MSLKNKLVKVLLQRKNQEAFDISKVKKTLIIRNSGIGDAICLEPMIRELKKAFPTIEIDVFASLGNRVVFDNYKNISNVFVKQKKRHLIKRIVEFLKMKMRKYDLIIDTTNYHFNKALMTYFLSPKWAIAVENNRNNIINRHELSFFIYILKLKETEHTVDKLLRFLNAFNVVDYDNNMHLEIPKSNLEKAKNYINKLNTDKIVAINIFATNKNRTLSFEQLVSLCKLFYKQDISVLLLFTIDKRNSLQSIVEQNNLTNVYLGYDTKSIFDAMALVSYVDVIVSPDTAYIHIASALNIPVVGLFWNNEQQINMWGPRSDTSKVITSKVENDNTLENIDLEEVSCEVEKILNEKSKI